MMRSFTARRTTLGLALLGAMALASGCDDSASNPAAPSDQGKAQSKNMMDAMSKQHAPGGPATSKTPQT